LTDHNGLQFAADGIAYDPEPLPVSNAAGSQGRAATFTLELWLEPAAEPNTDAFHILTIDDGQLPSNFALCQWRSYLLLRTPDATNERGFREVGIDGLHKRKARFVTIVGDASGTAFYADGVLVERFSEFVLPAGRLNGRLILGNAAEGKHSWAGRVFGLAMFERALDAAEVARHCSDWTNNRAGRLIQERALAAFYRFDERTGQQANDNSRHKHQLLVPPRYEVLHKLILALPRYDNPFDWFNLRDIAINVIGFVPFGYGAWRFRQSATRRPIRNAVFVASSGAALSLTIELVQVWLPHRSSSISDLVWNTFGTILGVLLAMFMWLRWSQRG
jgi:hypothetical protein